MHEISFQILIVVISINKLFNNPYPCWSIFLCVQKDLLSISMRHKQQEVECMKLVPVSGSAVVITFHLLPTVVTSNATIQSRINIMVVFFFSNHFLFCCFFLLFLFVFLLVFSSFFSFHFCNHSPFAGALLTGRPQFTAEST